MWWGGNAAKRSACASVIKVPFEKTVTRKSQRLPWSYSWEKSEWAWFAAGEAEFQGSGLGQLIHDAGDFSGTEFLTDRIETVETIRITHHAMQVATAGDLLLAGEWRVIGEVGECILSSHASPGISLTAWMEWRSSSNDVKSYASWSTATSYSPQSR